MSHADSGRALHSVDDDLRSPDEEVRRLAVERVSELSQSDALPRVVTALGDPGWRVRKSAVARALALPGASEVDLALIEALGDGENPGRRNAAAEALVRRGPSAIDALVDALATRDIDVRKQIVDVLAGIGHASAEPALRRMLRDTDANVAAAAADALGVVGAPESAADLIAAAWSEGSDRLLRVSALRSMTRLEVPVEARQLEPMLDDRVLRPAVLALLAVSDEPLAVELLIKGLSYAAAISRDAAAAGLVRVVGRCGPEEVPALVVRIREALAGQPGLVERIADRLDQGDLSSRMTRIQFLGIADDERVVLPLLETCRDEAVAELAHATLATMGERCEAALEEAWDRLDAALRLHVCRTFARTTGDVGAARLARALGESEPAVRIAAVEALGLRRERSGIRALVARLEAMAEGLDDERDDELESIVTALLAIAEEPGCDAATAVIAALARRIESASALVRLAAARVLARVGQSSDRDLVAQLLRDPEAEVRREAVGALARLSDDAATEPLRLALADESVAVRCAAALALGASGGEAILEDLVRLRSDEDSRVRAAALRAMGRLGARYPGAAAVAVEHLASAGDDDPAAAIAAAEALGEIGGVASVAGASAALASRTPEVVIAAISCIGRHGAHDDLTALLASTAHPDWTVRAEAIRTLARRGFAAAVPVILRRLESEHDGFVRETILAALSRLEG